MIYVYTYKIMSNYVKFLSLNSVKNNVLQKVELIAAICKYFFLLLLAMIFFLEKSLAEYEFAFFSIF